MSATIHRPLVFLLCRGDATAEEYQALFVRFLIPWAQHKSVDENLLHFCDDPRHLLALIDATDNEHPEETVLLRAELAKIKTRAEQQEKQPLLDLQTQLMQLRRAYAALHQQLLQQQQQHLAAFADSSTTLADQAAGEPGSGNNKRARMAAAGMPFIVYTDGSALNNGAASARAGCAAIADNREWSCRCPGRQTNQRAELYAAVAGVAMAREHDNAELRTDSEYVQLGVTDPTRLALWSTNGWKTKAKTAVANQDLWEWMAAALRLREECGLAPIKVVWVHAHSGIPKNEAADLLAKAAAARTPVSGAEEYPAFDGRDQIAKLLKLNHK